MRSSTGKCPGCDGVGNVAEPCPERGCKKRGLHFISEAHWQRAHRNDKSNPDPVIGQLVGDFLVVDLIGAGGFGKVYLALQSPLLGLKGALKLIGVATDDAEFSQALLEKFQSEAEVLAHLSHPNIVRLLKYGLHLGRPYLVMEYVEGERTLRGEIYKREKQGPPFSGEEILNILNQVLNALGAAHEASIIHRDIKPENIMLQSVVGNPHYVRLLDFGLAKFVEHHTDTRWHLGSPNYMAPEQISRKNLGPWTDLYAVAVMAFELFSGRRPFPGATEEQVLVHKIKADFDPLDQIADLAFPKAALDFLARGLAREPEERYGDVESFRAGLVEAVESLAGRFEKVAAARPAATMHLQSGDLKEVVARAGSEEEQAGLAKTRRAPPEVFGESNEDAKREEEPAEVEASAEQSAEEVLERPGGSGRWRLGVGAVLLLGLVAAGLVYGLGDEAVFLDQASQSTATDDFAALTFEEEEEEQDELDDALASLEPVVVDDANEAALDDEADEADEEEGRMLTSIALGKFHSCVLLRTGQVRCWGKNFDGELGLGHRERIGNSEPALEAGFVELGEPAIAITAAGDYDASFTCAILESRNVRCWGSNHFGQLGLGSQVRRLGASELPTAVDVIDVGGPVKQLASGAMQYASHVCALLEDGAVRCWGNNRHGQLGLGHTRHIGRTEVPANVSPVELGKAALQIAAGKFHSCAVLEGGTLRCWGRNQAGQLGLGHTENIGDDELPTAAELVDVGGVVEAVSVGRSHTCALLEGGRARCWGWNSSGQLGYGHTDNVGDTETPASAGDIDLGAPVEAISAGGQHTCALLKGGRVRCWGDNRFGQLGAGNRRGFGTEEVPARGVDVHLGGRAVAVEASNYHTCAILEDDTLRCWGFNDFGQLGYGHTEYVGASAAPAAAGPVPVLSVEELGEE